MFLININFVNLGNLRFQSCEMFDLGETSASATTLSLTQSFYTIDTAKKQ